MRTDDDPPPLASTGASLECAPGAGGEARHDGDGPESAALSRVAVEDDVLDVMIDIDEDVSVEATAWLPSRTFIAEWTGRTLASPLGGVDASVGDRRPAATADAETAADDVSRGELGADASDSLRPVRHELSVRLLAPETMRLLNRDWRGRDRPTNVLSFPAGLPVLALEEGGSVQVLGDLAFCPAVIAREAQAQGKPLEAHWAHLVVHGVLHLRGLDHEGEEEAADMESLERRLLSSRDIPDPYLARVPDGGPSRHD